MEPWQVRLVREGQPDVCCEMRTIAPSILQPVMLRNARGFFLRRFAVTEVNDTERRIRADYVGLERAAYVPKLDPARLR